MHAAPCLQCLVRREDHGAMPTVTFIHNMKEHVGRVGAVREVPDFVDHEDGRMRLGRQRLRELTGTKRGGEIVDERCRRRKDGIEAVLSGAVGDRDRQVRLASTGLARENQRATLGDKVGRERRAEHVQPQRRSMRTSLYDLRSPKALLSEVKLLK